MKRALLISLTLLFVSTVAFAQQRNMYSQYMLDKYSVNPAVAGSTPYSPIALSYKQFWTGINEAPSIQSLSGHFAIGDNMGVGGRLYNYSTSPTSIQGIEGTYAYHISVSDNSKLSLALTGMLYQSQLDKSELLMKDADDDVVLYSSNRLIVPDAGFGAYYYGENYYAGLSVPNLFNRRVDLMNDDLLDNRQVRHYFLHGGYIFEFGDVKAEPSVLLRYIEAGIFQADINAKATYKDMFSLGVSYRLGDAVAVMAGVGNKNILFGYSYDITLSNIKNASNGSHELMLIYKLGGVSSPPKFGG